MPYIYLPSVSRISVSCVTNPARDWYKINSFNFGIIALLASCGCPKPHVYSIVVAGNWYVHPTSPHIKTEPSIFRSEIHMTRDSNSNLQAEKWLKFQTWFGPWGLVVGFAGALRDHSGRRDRQRISGLGASEFHSIGPYDRRCLGTWGCPRG